MFCRTSETLSEPARSILHFNLDKVFTDKALILHVVKLVVKIYQRHFPTKAKEN